jgi:hypothetical protein
VITDPAGNVTTHTYAGSAPADIVKVGVGDYTLEIPCTVVGLWAYVWIGTGLASDVDAGTFTVNPASTLVQYYTSVEELKDRLGIPATDTTSDFQLLGAVESGAKAVEQYCGRFFYQMPDTRTYMPYNIYELPVDDIVSISSLAIDRDGDGIFEETWTQGVDYQLAYAPGQFAQLSWGEPRPFTLIRVINSGVTFPYIWEFSTANRVQVTGVFGWPSVPQGVRQAAMQTSAEVFKLKDSPFGLAGTSEFGLVRVPKQNPYIVKLLCTYVNARRKVGV